jgi:hypothetical protein
MTELQTTMADRPKRRNGAAHAPVVVSGGSLRLLAAERRSVDSAGRD